MGERRVHAHSLVGEVTQAVHVRVRMGGGGGDEPSAATAASSAGPVVRPGHQGEGRRGDVVHDVLVLLVLVVVVVMVVVVVGQWNSGVRRAWHRAHRVVGGVGLERVSLALGHGNVHGRQSLRASQQRLIQTRKYVVLELQGEATEEVMRTGNEGLRDGQENGKDTEKEGRRLPVQLGDEAGDEA
ncbi:hypothetical protein EYF80_015327 [Liparis tanakae]|uniref:Uncharacterized protein n=1 Tax=Liparis tanakae TaxID=230148 RepID=A0A4Z2I9D4_9TELE|nr:hypothetical protein EYF80_015327 [Liparis tanakae]